MSGKRSEIVAGLDEFISNSVVIPPVQIDYNELIQVDDIKRQLRSLQLRQEIHERSTSKSSGGPSPFVNGIPTFDRGESVLSTVSSTAPIDGKPKRKKRGDPLKRSGRIFGGMIDDIRYRLPYFKSDFMDGLNFQCVTSAIFIFFAAFAPAITFGGLLDKFTYGAMGVTETLIGQAICGFIWALMAGQPLMIMSATGPVAVFEGALYGYCKKLNLNFMTIRVWAGIWLFLISLVTVAFEGSFLIRYFTAFTEDIFATLISMIFIATSIKFLLKTLKQHPVRELEYYADNYQSCATKYSDPYQHGKQHYLGINSTINSAAESATNLLSNMTIAALGGGGSDSMMAAAGTNVTAESNHLLKACIKANQPDTGLLTGILMILTFVIALVFRLLKDQKFLGRQLRTKLGDFAVLIAIIITALVDFFLFPDPYLKRLKMPDGLDFTNSTARGAGIIIPFGLPGDQWYGYLFALVPALLVYILLFVETEITEVLLAKKERGCKKGTGFHWDLLLCCTLGLVCSIFGLPWMCAAAVQSLAHGGSLTVMKKGAPGEKPKVDYVLENRLTGMVVALLVGACAFAGSFLKHLPQATLFGVFLYLGVMNLVPVTFIHRLILFFVPEKYFPHTPYCQEVGMWRMHLYTLIQVICLALTYLIKKFEETSLAFPFTLMAMAAIRMFLLPKMFTQPELNALDEHEEEDSDIEDDSAGFF